MSALDSGGFLWGAASAERYAGWLAAAALNAGTTTSRSTAACLPTYLRSLFLERLTTLVINDKINDKTCSLCITLLELLYDN